MGMKIDFRFVVDIDSKEIDVGAGEAARESAAEAKIHHDEGKLLREGKDVIDGLVESCIGYFVDDLVGCILQTSGLSGEFSSVRLFGPQIYSAIPHYKVNIPRSILNLEPFIDTMSYLITMTEQMESMAHLLLYSYRFFEDRRLSFGKHFGRPKSLFVKDKPNYLSWRADTYYFPSNNERKNSVVPDTINLQQNDEEFIGVEPMNNEAVVIHENMVPDEWGFIKLQDGHYFNSYLKSFSDKHPVIDPD